LADPASITNATQEYRETSDVLAGFFPSVSVPDGSQRLDGSTAFTTYLEWCEAENLPNKERWTSRTFYSAMEEGGIQRARTAKGTAVGGDRRGEQNERTAGHGIFGRD